MNNNEPLEKVPDADVFYARIGWSRVEMETARSFERLIDLRLAQAKREIMQIYQDYRPAPAFFPKEETDT